MKPDIFSTAACRAAVASYREPRQLHAIPTATPRGERSTSTRNQRNTTSDVVVIDAESHAVFRPKLSRADVQSALSERAFEVYEQLRKLSAVTHSAVVEANFSPSLARYWLGEFVRRGLLRATPRGHVWTFEETNE